MRPRAQSANSEAQESAKKDLAGWGPGFMRADATRRDQKGGRRRRTFDLGGAVASHAREVQLPDLCLLAGGEGEGVAGGHREALDLLRAIVGGN